MATIATHHPSLLISLADVARLARVQRPVVSMWRSRSAATGTPFPGAVQRAGAQERFDADQVVTWLELTGRGNNHDVRADVAAFASLAGVSSQGEQALFDGLTALLTLKAIVGVQLGGLGAEALLDLADDADPDDSLLLREVTALGEDLSAIAVHVDDLSNADFNPAGAFERLMRDRFRRHLLGQAVVALREDARSLVAQVGRALTVEAGIRPALFVDPTCGGSDLLVAAVGLHDDEPAPSALTSDEDAPAGRLARRRLRVHDIPREDLHVNEDGTFEFSTPAVLLAQLPAPGMPSMTTAAMLTAIDNIAVQMADDQRAMVRAHAFRFTRIVTTRILLASRGNLLEVAPRVEPARAGTAAEIALRIGSLKIQLQQDHDVEPLDFGVETNPDIDNFSQTEHITVAAALTAGNLRVIAGNRMDPADLHATNGAPVIGPAELIGNSPPGQRLVDRLRFGASYDAGRYTEPGDVVFCTSPRIGAIVDRLGGSVVVSPARVLRVDRHKPHGLLPHVIAADINKVVPQAKQWRLWRLRCVPAEQLAPLRETLKAIAAERMAALDRVSLLDELAALVTAGVTDTTLTITTQSREEGR